MARKSKVFFVLFLITSHDDLYKLLASLPLNSSAFCCCLWFAYGCNWVFSRSYDRKLTFLLVGTKKSCFFDLKFLVKTPLTDSKAVIDQSLQF